MAFTNNTGVVSKTQPSSAFNVNPTSLFHKSLPPAQHQQISLGTSEASKSRFPTDLGTNSTDESLQSNSPSSDPPPLGDMPNDCSNFASHSSNPTSYIPEEGSNWFTISHFSLGGGYQYMEPTPLELSFRGEYYYPDTRNNPAA